LRKFLYVVLGAAALTCATSVQAIEAVDAGRFLRQQGWEPYDGKAGAKSLIPDVAPLMYYGKGTSVPSCGIVTAMTDGKRPGFIELVGSDPGADFPQCLDVVSMTPFRMRNEDYIAVEFHSRDTREDTYRGYHYLKRDRSRGIVTDEALTGAVPLAALEGSREKPKSAAQGVRLARIAHMAKAYPAWDVSERDFISDRASSFAILHSEKAQQCQFVAESGGAPALVAHTTFASGAACAEVLASSRYEMSGKVFYLAMFRDHDGKQLVGVMSVGEDGRVSVEKALADRINRAGVTGNMQSAKAALVKELQ
jgi:hypothetical protein